MSPTLDSEDIDQISEKTARRMTESGRWILSKEQQAALQDRPVEINEKIRFSWQVVVTIVGVALSLGGVGYVAKAAAEDAGVARSEVKSQAQEVKALQIQAAQNETAHEAMKDSLKRIERKLDQLTDKVR